MWLGLGDGTDSEPLPVLTATLPLPAATNNEAELQAALLLLSLASTFLQGALQDAVGRPGRPREARLHAGLWHNALC